MPIEMQADGSTAAEQVTHERGEAADPLLSMLNGSDEVEDGRSLGSAEADRVKGNDAGSTSSASSGNMADDEGDEGDENDDEIFG